MTPDQQVKLLLGELQVATIMLRSQVEQLQAEVERLKALVPEDEDDAD